MEAFRPQSAKVAWDAPAGWPKAKIAGLKPSDRAKVEMYKSTFRKYPVEIQNAVMAHRLPDRGDEVAVALAWGEPDYFWDVDKQCRAMLYAVDRTQPHLITTCEGEIDDALPLLRNIPCEVLEATVARAEAGKKAFARLTADQQLDVLARHRASWMDDAALKLAFGERAPRTQGDGPIAGPREGAPMEVAPRPTPVAPVPVEAPPEPEDPVAAADEEEEDLESDTEPQPQPQPVPAPAPVSAAPTPVPAVVAPVPVAPEPRRVAARYESSSVGSWSWSSVCGEVEFDFEVDVGEGYLVEATARPSDGSLIRYVTRGKAVQDTNDLRLLGFANGVLTDDTLSVALGAWPVPACRGVVAKATP